jgi:hypothetical protein
MFGNRVEFEQEAVMRDCGTQLDMRATHLFKFFSLTLKFLLDRNETLKRKYRSDGCSADGVVHFVRAVRVRKIISVDPFNRSYHAIN